VGPSHDSVAQSFLGWVLGCAFVYAALFGAGSFLYGELTLGFFWLVVFIVSGVMLTRVLKVVVGNE
jgi:hypothetical protein